ncbi:MAG: FG-GAP-like repeat-containing protein [Syntrophales bacterium]|nr:FG-GAP-like repeat-containing protein [Syntrophales bacterium]
MKYLCRIATQRTVKKAFIICLFALIAVSGQLWAKEKTTLAVLPFSVHSAENIDYLHQGIWDMLSSRIAADGKIEVISKDAVIDALKGTGEKELTLTDVYGLGKKMSVDFVVWGSITKIGNSLSIDGKLVDITTYKSPVGIFTQSQGMDEVIPKISDFAQRINYHILGAPSPPTSDLSPVTSPLPMPQQPTPQYTRESEIISGMKTSKKGTFTSVINPDFINAAQPLDRKGFWMSQKYPTEFKGMDIGDVNKDGLNEVVVIDSHNVMIYQKKGKDFNLLQQISGKSYDNYLAVDVADINQDGVKEIFVTSLRGNMVNSFVLEFKMGRFVEIASNLRWFLRVIDSSSDTPLLLGQRMGSDKAFDTPIYEIVWVHGKYREGRKMKIPEGLSIYGLTMESLGAGGGRRIIALDSTDHLCIYEETDKPLAKIHVFGGSNELLWKGDDVFGGSNNYFEKTITERYNKNDKYTYLNVRILTHDINKDGKKEIIIVKNLSSVGRIFKNLRLFTSSEIYNLEWDGLGLAENWRTRKINGYAADYQLKDIDNDGQDEIVLALVLSGGKSAIVAYKLNVQ